MAQKDRATYREHALSMAFWEEMTTVLLDTRCTTNKKSDQLEHLHQHRLEPENPVFEYLLI